MMISRSKLTGIHQELKSLGTLPVPDDFKYHLIKGEPRLTLGFHGDFAINVLSGNIYWKNGTSWITALNLLKGKTRERSIYTKSLSAPLHPMGDVNIGWSDTIDSANLVNKHLWESKAQYVGDVRISAWTAPEVKILGRIETQEAETITSHTIYIVSKHRPPIRAKVDDPTVDSRWLKVYPGVKNRDDVIWESSTIKNQHGKIKRPWSTPKQVAVKDGEKGEPGKKVMLEFDAANQQMVQRYEGETETTAVATRETIVGNDLIQLPGRVTNTENELTNKINTSDISAWAKEPTKPAYDAAEVGAKPDTWQPAWDEVQSKPAVIIEGDARLTDARPASDVPGWAKKTAIDAEDLPVISTSKVSGLDNALAERSIIGEVLPELYVDGNSRFKGLIDVNSGSIGFVEEDDNNQSNWRLYPSGWEGSEVRLLMLRNFREKYGVTQISGLPVTDSTDLLTGDSEATLALYRGTSNEQHAEIMDVFNNGYHSSSDEGAVAYGIRLLAVGDGQIRDFVIDSKDSSSTYQRYITIKPSGTVGIGTTTPSSNYKLDVNGNLNGMQLDVDGVNVIDNFQNGYFSNIRNNTENDARYVEVAGDTMTGDLTISSGTGTRLNVGTPSTNKPTMTLGRRSGNPSIKSNDYYLMLDGGGTSGRVSINHYASGNVILGSGGGNVGIGTFTPNTELHVADKSTFGNGTTAGTGNKENIINILAGLNSAGGTNGIKFYENASFGMSMGYDGTGSGDDNKIVFYDNNNSMITEIMNGGDVRVKGDVVAYAT